MVVTGRPVGKADGRCCYYYYYYLCIYLFIYFFIYVFLVLFAFCFFLEMGAYGDVVVFFPEFLG